VDEVEMRVGGDPRPAGQKTSFAIRPEAFKVAEQLTGAEKQGMGSLRVKISKVEYLGYMTKYDLDLGGNLSAKMVSYDVLPQSLRKEGEALEIFYDPKRVLVY
jgi:ABC-type Fe3+/spermidine/putrescine transport system ATPase subunit